MFKVHTLPALSDNYIFVLVSDNEVTVIDPGNAKTVIDFLTKHNLSLTNILCTHHHADHTAGNLTLKEFSNCKIYGAHHDRNRIPGIDETLQEGDTLNIHQAKAVIMETWGHTVGHISYYFAQENKVFCGDTLFSAGCGRLFEGTPENMFASLQKLAALPEQTEVYCAHEYTESNIRFALSVDTNNQELNSYAKAIQEKRQRKMFSIPSTIGIEKTINPFLRCHDHNIKRKLSMEDSSTQEIFTKLRQLKDQF